MNIIDNARNMHNAFYRSMARGGRWNLYRKPQSDNIIICQSDDEWDGDAWPIMVPDVHTMTSDRLALKVQSIVRS